MKTHVGDRYGRHVIMQLTKGEQILESIERELRRLDIRCGILTSGIGSARKIVFHRIKTTGDDPVNEFVTLEAALEIGAMQGVIVDYVPHIHITFTDPSGGTISGHLEPGCEVQYLVELSIVELLGEDLTRKLDEFGITYIDVR